MRKLGSTQTDVLCCLVERGTWCSDPRVWGWVWTTHGATKRFLDRLVELGYARVRAGVYKPTPAGVAYAATAPPG